MYIADSGNERIRRVDAVTRIITTVVGNGSPGYIGDNGPALAAQLRGPRSIAFDSGGNLYIADLDNDVIRKVDAATQIITTVAGTGHMGYSGDGGPPTHATLNNPSGVAVDQKGNVYIADTYNDVVRQFSGSTIITYAGTSTPGHSGDGGPAIYADMRQPVSVASTTGISPGSP